MPYIHLKNDHYVIDRHSKTGAIGIITGDMISFYECDETCSIYENDGITYFSVFDKHDVFDVPLDEPFEISLRYENGKNIDNIIGIYRFKHFYIDLMEVVIAHIKNGNFADLIHDKIEDVIKIICFHSNQQQAERINGIMGDIAITVVNIENDPTHARIDGARHYKALIAKIADVTHVFFRIDRIEWSGKRTLIGRSYYSHNEDRNIDGEIARIMLGQNMTLDEFNPQSISHLEL